MTSSRWLVNEKDHLTDGTFLMNFRMIIGPERSGTTVHIDPLYTSAWNTSLAGYKRWVVFGKDVPKTIVKGKEFRGKHYED